MERLICLTNGDLEVCIAPQLGGRVTHLRRPGGRNMLLFDERALERRIEHSFSPQSRFVTLNGHIVWLAPQSDWWRQQDENPSRRQRGVPWPPDPWLVRGLYSVVQQHRDRIVLRSPASPVSGLRLRKTVAFRPDGSLRLAVDAQNVCDRVLRWGLWHNTRVSGFARCYVPVAGIDSVRIAAGENPVPHEVTDGWFSFRSKRQADAPARSAKAFIVPRAAFMAAFQGGDCLAISGRALPAKRIAPGQAPIEIYNGCGTGEGDSLLELELHGPYRELPPGARMRSEETWRLLPYDGPARPSAQRAFLEAVLAAG
ncbi:MAG: DUF4380 domain-containing protein [Planctomycetota bacterium]